MAGETDLQRLLKTLDPQLNAGLYAFCSLSEEEAWDPRAVVMAFREAEGLTLIAPQAHADQQGWQYDYVAAWITLRVHSALEAVGLTAAFSQALGREGISCNVVAALHHDHIFVAPQDAERAMAALRRLAEEA